MTAKTASPPKPMVDSVQLSTLFELRFTYSEAEGHRAYVFYKHTVAPQKSDEVPLAELDISNAGVALLLMPCQLTTEERARRYVKLIDDTAILRKIQMTAYTWGLLDDEGV